MLKPLAICLAAATLGGCAYLSPPAENPIIEQHAKNRVNTFAVVPARRMMIVKSDGKDDAGNSMTICAEAPADVTDNIASTFAASLAASAKGAEASAGITRTLETFGQILFKRTQGVQLFRDRSFYLCQARMNGFITDAQYLEQLNLAFEKVLPLVEREVITTAPQAPAMSPAVAQARATLIPIDASTPNTSVVVDKDGKVTTKVTRNTASAAEPK